MSPLFFQRARLATLLANACFLAGSTNAPAGTPDANSAFTHSNETPSIRAALRAVVSTPPSAESAQRCTRLIDVASGKGDCADRHDVTSPTIFSTPYDNGKQLVKLSFSLRSGSPSTFTLPHLDVATGQHAEIARREQSSPVAATLEKALSMSPNRHRVALIRVTPWRRDSGL